MGHKSEISTLISPRVTLSSLTPIRTYTCGGWMVVFALPFSTYTGDWRLWVRQSDSSDRCAASWSRLRSA